MFSLNRAQLVGNMTRDPEMKYIPSGQAVASFSIATNRRWKDKDGNPQEQTEFHEIVAWGKLAELSSQLFHKGNKVYIEGRIQTRNWEGQDGNKRNRTEIVMEDFILLSPKGTGYTGGSAVAADEVAIEEIPEETPKKDEKKDDLPANDKKTDTKAKDKEEDLDEINLDDIPF